MTTLDPWQELIKGLQIAEEYNRTRTIPFKEFRLYYNDDGTVIGLWESDHPAGDNYIVLEDPDQYHRHNTHLIRVNDNNLTIISPVVIETFKLIKSNNGQPVVRGHAAIALGLNEEYSEIEFYDRKNS